MCMYRTLRVYRHAQRSVHGGVYTGGVYREGMYTGYVYGYAPLYTPLLLFLLCFTPVLEALYQI